MEVVTIPLAKMGIEFEPCNPLTSLLDTETGIVHDDVRNEKILSAIVEFKIPEERFAEVAATVYDAARSTARVRYFLGAWSSGMPRMVRSP